MFTGIIRDLLMIQDVVVKGSNIMFKIKANFDFISKVHIDESVSHDGVCLTIEEIDTQNFSYQVTAIEETLRKTTLNKWEKGKFVNIERAMSLNSLLDGHLVQGHVDAIGTVEKIQEMNGSHEIFINYPTEFQHLIVQRGSIAVNGISLTVAEDFENQFKVAIIPYTWQNTNLRMLTPNDSVNLEFDIIGKYLAKWKSIYS